MINLYEVNFKGRAGFLLMDSSEDLKELKEKYSITEAKRVRVLWPDAYNVVTKLEKIPLLNKNILNLCNFSLEIDYDEYNVYYYHLSIPNSNIFVAASINEIDEVLDIKIEGIEYDPDFDDLEEQFVEMFLELKAEKPYKDIISLEYIKNFGIKL